MRRRKDPEKRKKQMALFIIVVMVLSVAGFIGVSFSGGGSSLTYNGQKFYQSGQGFRTKISGDWINFNFHPIALESIQVSEYPKVIGILTQVIRHSPKELTV